MRGDHHPAVDPVDPVDHHRRQTRKPSPATALISHNLESTTPSRPEPRPLQGSPRLHGEWARTTYRDQRHACGINPQVMLTTLQKESQGLTRTDVTDSSCAAAWGWYRPDTGP